MASGHHNSFKWFQENVMLYTCLDEGSLYGLHLYLSNLLEVGGMD